MNPAIRAVFVDRDGTIIEDLHYAREPERVTLIPNAVAGLKLLQAKGYRLFLVSNQAGVARGVISPDAFRAVHARFEELLRDAGVTLDASYYCLHAPEDKCPCRKPAPGLVPRDFQGRTIDRAGSFVIGDKDVDVKLGHAIGADSFLVLTGKGQKTWEDQGDALQPVTLANDLLAAAEKIPSAG